MFPKFPPCNSRAQALFLEHSETICLCTRNFVNMCVLETCKVSKFLKIFSHLIHKYKPSSTPSVVAREGDITAEVPVGARDVGDDD